MLNLETTWRHDRVRATTAPEANDRIDMMTRARVEHLKDAPRDAIVSRISDLDREWDITRILIINYALGVGVAMTLSRFSMFFRVVARTQTFFLMTHAIAGWCPPLGFFRRMGIRTMKEIQGEREALLAILRDRNEPLDAPLLDSLPPDPWKKVAPSGGTPT